jgi:hypothetical protein
MAALSAGGAVRKISMRDEYWLLRPVILLSAGFLVLSAVLHACREAAEQRARLRGCPAARAAMATSVGSHEAGHPATMRVFPTVAVPGAGIEAGTPFAD